jgi:DNA polymerase-3 subunit epsilon
MLGERLVFVDLETTGAAVTHDRITEIGLVEVEDGRVTAEWSSLVNPETSIPPAIQALTGITNAMVAAAPRFGELARGLRARLEGRLFVAHNARFDYGFLKNEFRRLGLAFDARVLCTVKLSRRLYPQHARHNLDALLARHGLDCEARHRALGDARVLWRLVQAWRGELGDAALEAAAARLLRSPAAPAGLPEAALDGVPQAPGVYLFYGDNDVVLYVGKSVNLRTRVLSHFSGDHRTNKDMRIVQQIRRVDWVLTAGELGALLKESELVKTLAPVHNRQLRRSAELCAWHWRAGCAGAPALVDARGLDIAHFDDLYGVFRSRATAIEALREIAAAHGLCGILIGLEKRTGPCFAHQIGRCRGACVGLESREAHALRLGAALATLRIRRWPYRGPIGVREQAGERRELHVLDRWCYLGTARTEAELREIERARPRAVFDLDTYKLLSRFLATVDERAIVPLAA